MIERALDDHIAEAVHLRRGLGDGTIAPRRRQSIKDLRRVKRLDRFWREGLRSE